MSASGEERLRCRRFLHSFPAPGGCGHVGPAVTLGRGVAIEISHKMTAAVAIALFLLSGGSYMYMPRESESNQPS